MRCLSGKPLKGFQESTGMVRSVSEDEYDGGSKQEGGKGNKLWNQMEEGSD